MSEDDDLRGWDASRLRGELAAQNITQKQMAEDLGWSENTVGSYTMGRTAPSVARLSIMARYLGRRVVDLLVPEEGGTDAE